MKLESEFDIRDHVYIDDDRSVRGVVVAIRWGRDRCPQYEIGWINNGSAEFVYMDEWRLSK